MEAVLGAAGRRATSSWRSAWRFTPTIHPAGRPEAGETFFALNDIAVARGSLARVCRIEVEIGPSHLATFTADGLVVSSPTGSTGYSFSAGGPIVDPTSRNLVVTPIAGYLSAIRSVVVSPRHTVRVPHPRCVRRAHERRRARGPAAVGRRRRLRVGDAAGRSASSSRAAPFRSGICFARSRSCCRHDRGCAGADRSRSRTSSGG